MSLQIPLLQSNMVVMIETDANLTGIGEGGTLDTLNPCAGRLIGKNPFEIERLWQDMYKAFHYPPGRERLHAIGALTLPCGISRARRWACRFTSCRRHEPKLPRVLYNDVSRDGDAPRTRRAMHGGRLALLPVRRGQRSGHQHLRHA